MGKYRQNKKAPTKFSRPVAARAPARPIPAVRTEIIAGAIATPPEVSMRNEARNSLLAPGGARSAPRIMLIPAETAFASAVTDAIIQNVATSVTMKEKR